jgi:alkylation response protein AidB-like acyl-CoA dehydrogenase
MVPALALTAAMPALGSAELVADLFARRLGERVLAYSGAAQKDQPSAQVRLGDARVRLRALRGVVDAAADDIQARVSAGQRVCWRYPAPAPSFWITRCSAQSAMST